MQCVSGVYFGVYHQARPGVRIGLLELSAERVELVVDDRTPV
jgi:hypothetical protein